MNRWILTDYVFDYVRERNIILGDIYDRNAFEVFVSADAVKTFEHLVAMDFDCSLLIKMVSNYQSPNRIRMQNYPSPWHKAINR